MHYVISLVLIFNGVFVLAQGDNSNFKKLNKEAQWNLVFDDDCTKDWTEHWTLDGLVATVENSKEGMNFKAGPEYNNDAHHGVLWTKQSFTGDLKIEYDYIKTDHETRCVNILYVQATGDDEDVYEKDISKWSKRRELPAMRTYFENMNAFHISYAAFGNKDDGTFYVRARRYPKTKYQPFTETQLEPSYDQKGYFKSGEKYHITVIKTDEYLFFKMESNDDDELFSWNLSKITPIKEGRIGLRHMFTRSSIYKNFKIYTK